MSKHTQEPWFVNEDGIIRVGKPNVNDYMDPIPIASAWREGAFSDGEETEESQDNARRIVACVNACQGIKTEDLFALQGTTILKTANEVANSIIKQRDELLAAAKELMAAQAHYDELDAPGSARLSRLEWARNDMESAIAKAEATHG
jgi:hypothetical protein